MHGASTQVENNDRNTEHKPERPQKPSVLGDISKKGQELGREENPDSFWSCFPKGHAKTWTTLRAVVDSMFAETQKAKDKMTFGFLQPGGEGGLTLPSSQINLEVDIYFIFSSISPVKK